MIAITIQRLNKITYTLDSKEIKLGELIQIIKDNKYTISASGALFRTDKQSVTATILEKWFAKREHYRGMKKQRLVNRRIGGKGFGIV